MKAGWPSSAFSSSSMLAPPVRREPVISRPQPSPRERLELRRELPYFGRSQAVARIWPAQQNGHARAADMREPAFPARRLGGKPRGRDAVQRAIHDNDVLAGKPVMSRNHDAVEAVAQRDRVLELHGEGAPAALPLDVKRWQDAWPPRRDQDIGPGRFELIALFADRVAFERGDVRAQDSPRGLEKHALDHGREAHGFGEAHRLVFHARPAVGQAPANRQRVRPGEARVSPMGAQFRHSISLNYRGFFPA